MVSKTNANNTKVNSIKKKGFIGKRKEKFKEKLDMYDMILANLYAGKAIIEPEKKLNNSQIAIGFSNIASENQITKYFVINEFPDYVPNNLFDLIRNRCMHSGVRINFYTYGEPYKINWDSAEMRNKLMVWEKYSNEHSSNVSVFNYRNDIKSAKTRERIVKSTMYLNEAELEHKRSLVRTSFIIEVSARRDEESIVNMMETIIKLKSTCSANNIKVKELRINMIDWIRALNPFSLNSSKEVSSKIIKKVMTDDNLANFNGYKQGRVGMKGIPLGIDILSSSVILRQFKEDPNKAENWLVCAETGGGKSLWVKSLLSYFLGCNYTVSVMDYEGDEYTNYANYVRASDNDDVKVVSMGKGSTVYFDPCEIPDLTGDLSVDDDLKESSINFITAIFRIITHGDKDDFTTDERKIMSIAIQRMYDSVGVTEEKETWARSKGLRLHFVYNEIKLMVEQKEFIDSDTDNKKHRAAMNIMEATSLYFEEGSANYSMFSQPMSANELYKAQLIIFSFGMKGASDSTIDPVMLALKQLSVGYVNIQISNYCKYVKKFFNVKVWEEFQRYGVTQGSAEVISNVITGGRKRGDINFIITNDLASLLDENNPLSNKLGNNIQNYAIGRIIKKETRAKFCESFGLQECRTALDKIAKASASIKNIGGKIAGTQNKYKYSFCVVLDDGNKAIVKSMLPKSILNSELFTTGVQIK